ncbi:MAG: glycosyl transferase [Anaerolineales bacterium]|nr:glycosyl transferase [Anaerolineales bacterium]
MKFGYFDDKNREYVIKRPDTPLPWINYLGSESYFGLISNTAGGYSFYKDARLRRLTRYRYNNAPLDSSGRYIYLRDDRSQGGDFWSPTWQPTRSQLDDYECRHGLGYTTIKSAHKKIEAQIRYFVPLGENLEIWQLALTNQRAEPALLSVFSAVEFNLWDAMDDATNFQRNYSIGEVEVLDGVIYHKTEYRERRDHFAFLACSTPVIGFDTQREAFLGAYQGWDAPLGVEKGKLRGSIAHGWQPVGVQQIKVELAPGEAREIIFLLGYHENPRDQKFDPPNSNTINKRTVLPVIEKYCQTEAVQAAFHELRTNWTELLDIFQVKTPDIHTNRMVNIWNAYQTMVTFNMSRSASYFESGIGRGMGFRDSNQDLLGFVQMVPERARERILDLAATQLESGGAYHQYQPLTKRGNHDVGGNFNDDPLWLVLAVSAYLKETGDWSILDEPVPYDNQPGSEQPLYDHLQRALLYTIDRRGPNGLPLIGRADWNDCLNLNCFSSEPGQSFQTVTSKDGKVAESVFIAGLFVLASKEMLQIARHVGDEHQINKLSSAIDEIEASVWSAGWDGEWFRRAYDDFGKPIGAKVCEEGKIFIEPQGICIMAGLGLENGRAEKALNSVSKYLSTPHGIVLHQPAYTRYYLEYGEISSYPPGYKENAGIFCHTNPWIMIAEAVAGRAEMAFDYYRRINPSNREEISEVHKCEPYVYAQMIAGSDAPTHGEAKNSWLTGTAAWNYVAITQWILGIRPEVDGLRIDPCIPSDWKGFKAVRRFRGKQVRIEVQNPEGACKGVASVTLNGETLADNLIPADKLVDENEVLVRMGSEGNGS